MKRHELKPCTTMESVVMGLQHTVTMFASVILVPTLLGLDVSVAILMAGIETLIFHFVTKNEIPIFLGSSFEFMPALLAVSSIYGMDYARGGMVVCCFVYILFAAIVKMAGTDKILKMFPPVISGSISILVGLSLASYATELSANNWTLAIMSFSIVGAINIFGSGKSRNFSILISLFISYMIAVFFTLFGIIECVDFSGINSVGLIGVPRFQFPKYNLNSVLIILPYTLCGIVDHIGDIVVAGMICKKDFTSTPGVHRTLLGDGIAAMASSLLGGPPNATYSENIGLMAITKNYDTLPLRIAAIIAIALGFIPKVSAFIASIPSAVVGGVSILLFGTITVMGIRQFIDNRISFDTPDNVIIVSTMLIIGLGNAELKLSILGQSFSLEGIGLATIVGILLNVIINSFKHFCQRT